ncbi:MAG: hypothetical protein II896_03850 [Clostridia bacterium]|nr:hypothetical protein [Clostridia bacterium]
MEFQGTREEIITQLVQYMSKEDAIKFFYNEFISIPAVTNRGLGSRKLSRVNLHSRARARMGKTYIYRKRVARKRNMIRIKYAAKPSTVVSVKGRSIEDDGQEMGINIEPAPYANVYSHSDSAKAHDNIPLVEINKKKIYFRKYTTFAFIIACVALDITLSITLGFAPITMIAGITAAVSPRDELMSVKRCIIDTVKNGGCLPKRIRNRNCKNISWNCPFATGIKCKIPEKKYYEIVSELIESNYLIIKR